MSDGPHRSLPLNRGWKKFVEYADNHAYSADEVCAALPSALERDWKKDISPAFLSSIKDVLGDTSQGSLLSDSKINQLETMRSEGVGNGFANTLIDCSIDAVQAGLFGAQAVGHAIASALHERAYDGIRSVEEHYQRHNVSGQKTLDIRSRLESGVAKCSLNDIALELSSKGKLGNNYKLSQNTSLDDGPPL